MSYIVTDQRGKPFQVFFSVILTIFTLGYFLPWMIASLRGKSNAGAIFWVNLLAGWTVIGWIIALVMSATAHQAFVVR